MVDFIVCWKDPTLIIVYTVIVFDNYMSQRFQKVNITSTVITMDEQLSYGEL